jgi:hypothetical protein
MAVMLPGRGSTMLEGLGSAATNGAPCCYQPWSAMLPVRVVVDDFAMASWGFAAYSYIFCYFSVFKMLRCFLYFLTSAEKSAATMLQ